jgi:hypothetical protein
VLAEKALAASGKSTKAKRAIRARWEEPALNRRDTDVSTDVATNEPSDVCTNELQRKGSRREKEVERRAGAPGGKAYAFEGRVIRLTEPDFAIWAERYHAIPDLRAELASIDAKWADRPEAERKGWFPAVSGWLNREHQRRIAEQAARARPAGGVKPPADEAAWAKRVEGWRESRGWSIGWGPEPVSWPNDIPRAVRDRYASRIDAERWPTAPAPAVDAVH